MAKHNEDVIISIFFNKSRKDKNGKYKVALQVNFTTAKKRKYYSTKFAFSEKEFESTWETTRPRNEYKDGRKELQALLTKADAVAGSLNTFNFEDFERLMFNKVTTAKNVNYYYSKKIEACFKRKAISTAKSYETALKALLKFHKKPNLSFYDVTVSWLDQFETFYVEDEKRSLTTVGIYTKTLRTIFNDAIEDKTISIDIYPFGLRKYRIPTPEKVKKALTLQQLKALFNGTPKTKEQEQAKAFWFFSYLCNGMNFKDVLNLKCKDFDGERIHFIRAKTAKSIKTPPIITVYPDPYAIDILNEYGNPNGNPNEYIFNILNYTQTAEQQYRILKNFIRLNNQHFLKYAKDNGINEKISSYWARHSFTTIAVQKGASMEQVGEAVGHTNTKTTQAYFAGFEDETKKQIGSNLLDF